MASIPTRRPMTSFLVRPGGAGIRPIAHAGVLRDGLAPWEKDERRRFAEVMARYRDAYGADGRKAFAMPAGLSSSDPQYRKLDRLTVGEWLAANGFRGTRLLWYVNYCCRDDFGTGMDTVSAWMGVHYFASRAGKGFHAGEGAFLTWPEGLGRLTTGWCGAPGDAGNTALSIGSSMRPGASGRRISESGTREILAQSHMGAAPCRQTRHRPRPASRRARAGGRIGAVGGCKPGVEGLADASSGSPVLLG
jgi:hypothetical protein